MSFSSGSTLSRAVSNPISGEVGAAASSLVSSLRLLVTVSNPISGEVGAAAGMAFAWGQGDLGMFQTPSAGRWVLQQRDLPQRSWHYLRFKPHQRGGGCCSRDSMTFLSVWWQEFQTPSAGRWVLQLSKIEIATQDSNGFQTPSAGRWVLQQDVCVRKEEVVYEFQTPSAGRWVLQLALVSCGST